MLRVLVVNAGSSWRRELTQDLALLRVFKGEPEGIDESTMGRAIEALKRDGLLETEERVKGMMDGPCEDTLIYLTELDATRSALSRDGGLIRYMYQRAAVSRK